MPGNGASFEPMKNRRKPNVCGDHPKIKMNQNCVFWFTSKSNLGWRFDKRISQKVY